MGNLCGKESSDPFVGPGRQLGSSTPQGSSSHAPVPQGNKPKITGFGRTLGGNTHGGARDETGDGDARRQAAKAAEERAKSRQPKGKLGTQLAQQRQQTRTDTLGSLSEDRRMQRKGGSLEPGDWN
ncbi:hypothetical protein FGG08_001676 [Glutinoglossum americanum]|uniref:Uncharacterized protein n=1 Tax=Glutinoglossum americanum TaxID=1670608 RepID=A0A9P8I6A4_9PEZI|nr:hypothetical protein FGG08_001676 [Glutinoglossum americanum]